MKKTYCAALALGLHLSLVSSASGGNCTSTQLPLVGVNVWPNPDASPPISNAIDQNTGTFTWCTQAFTMVANTIAVDVGATPMFVSRLRLWKDPCAGDGNNSVEPKDLVIRYSTDRGPLQGRNWQQVTGLINGFQGTELMVATSVNTNGTVVGDVHDSLEGDRWASLSFDTVQATGVSIEFDQQSGSAFCCNHYKVFEFELWWDQCPALFEDLGNPLGGTPGLPVFTATSTLLGGEPLILELSNAEPAQIFQDNAILVAGFSAINAAFMGGILVPAPDFLAYTSVDPQGMASHVYTVPMGLPSGLEFYMQWWIKDFGGPFGFAASNAIKGTIP